MKATAIQQGWTQEGTFQDADGALVRCYDYVAVLEDVESEPDSNGSVVKIPAGSTGAVLFYSTGTPCWLEVEYDLPGAIFGVIDAGKTRLAIKNEEKR